MKNSQLGSAERRDPGQRALIVAGSNWLARAARRGAIRPDPPIAPAVECGVAAASPEHRAVVAMMPKNKGNPYFVSCRQGAEEAAQELGVEAALGRPDRARSAKQNEVVEAWITRGVQAIAVSVENQRAMSTVLRKARGRASRW